MCIRMNSKDNFKALLMFTLTGLLVFISLVESIPLNSKAAGWMSSASEDDSRSYSHLGGGSKFTKAAFSTQPRSSYHTGGGNNPNRTLAAILLLTVFGIGATAFFVIICSKITKKDQYDSVKGTIY